ncbi:MAG: TIGR04084 family radical SAM/SPASM domain-containing protein [Candidatus Nanoarchaeia archaeon]|nr:TIGR04084 family radical SAM/SPASM domain-containing protein [Candidatus Nanoarchaeia archaeon]MDD5357552.1 TIGR04084 family radical SAM/SPASM domain-containing protein [Candidatus Nanoarchaeia archaeon]MDD5588471.1 TIGR04084 family radical SAM/SPASM domain-containing protein [Candidatus Nanoarchaeia archaeon]
MHYHLILTENCNSDCRYCCEKSMSEFDNGLDKKFQFDFSESEKFEVGINDLKKFLEKDKNPVLIFYGGEPLLEIEKIKKIIDEIKVPFRMQTNGKLLDELPIDYVRQIGKILVSLDGDKGRTDFNRGRGTYDKVVSNIKKIKESGYDGELIARMTVSQDFPDIYEQVLSLINSGFDSVHWQLDAGFYRFDFDENKFQDFVLKYNKSISKLINYWIGEMKKGKVLKLYPFLGIMESILKNEKTKLRCGAGHSGYAITQSGKIVVCPIMNCIRDFYAGDIKNSSPENLKKFSVSEPCTNCDYLDLCGGRCLYWNKSKLWPRKGDELICSTIKYLIDELKNKKSEIENLIRQKIISESDFEYEKYFGPEIIP